MLELEDNTHLECVTDACASSNLAGNTKTHKTYCIDCGKEIDSRATRCKACESINRRSIKPVSREELKNLIRIYPMVQIGKKYNVSDNAIRKWCKSYNLPYKVSEIKLISDEDWELI